MRARAVGRTHAGPGAVQAASRQRGSRSSNQEPPAGRPDSNHRTRQGQRTTSGSGTGSQRQHQRQRPGRRSHQTRPRPRPPARSRNARACERYCWAAGQALRVRKPKIFLGKGSKNRFRGAGAGKVGGVKNATEEENGAVLGKKEAAYAAADDEKGGRLYIWNGRALAYARGDAGCAEVGGGEASDGGYHFRGITKMVRERAGRRCRDGK